MLFFHILSEHKVHVSLYSPSDFKTGMLDNVDRMGAAATFT